MERYGQLEVEITFGRSKYKAVCSAFPGCKGLGDTEELAVKDLCKSISKMIEKAAKSSIEDIFNSDSFTEVVLDMNDDAAYKQKRVYSLGVPKQALSSTVQLKLKDLPEFEQVTDNDTETDFEQLLTSLEAPLRQMKLSEQMLGFLSRQSLSGQNPEGFGFGVPLSLN